MPHPAVRPDSGNRCTGHNRQGHRCGMPAIPGHHVCRLHGGSLKRTKDAALRNLAMANLSGQRVLLELGRIAFADVSGYFNEDGSLKPLSRLTQDQRAALQSLEVLTANVDSTDRKQERIHRIRTWDKVKALEILAKHFRLLESEPEKAGVIEIRWRAPESPVQLQSSDKSVVEIQAVDVKTEPANERS
jgi:hypothetical protein